MRRLVRLFALGTTVAACSLTLVGAPRRPEKAAAPRAMDIGFLPFKGAISPSGEDYRQNLHLTHNGTRDTAILTYTTLSGGLYAHYFDGWTFTPPVNIVPPEGSKTSVIGDRVCHAFLNTKLIPNPAANARCGDAIIFFTAMDADGDGASPADGENRVLYCAYFDATYAADPSHNYGFQTVATRVSDRDGEEENVICHGIVSDGLIGEARWLNYQYSYKFGDEISGLAVFWTQAENVDGDAEVEDLATCSAFFDLGQAGPASDPLVPGPDIRIATSNFGASDSGATADQTRTEARYLVYNNQLVLRCAANSSGLGAEPDLWNFGSVMHEGDDITLQCVAFDFSTLTVGPAHPIHGPTPSATDNRENNAIPLRQDGSFLSGGHCMYGADEGLSRSLLVFAEFPDGQAGTSWGTLANNARLAAAEIDPATGALLGHDFLDDEDPAIFDSVGSTAADLRLSRNGDYVFVAWIETRHAGSLDDKALWSALIATPRGTATPAPFASRVSPCSPVSTDIDDYPVTWFAFQEGLEYVGGAQSNPLVMNIFYQQSCHIDDEVWNARLAATLSPLSFASSVGVIEYFTEGSQPGMGSLNEEHYLFNGTDRGSDGVPIAFYIKDDTSDAKARLSLYSETAGSAVAKIDRPHPYTQTDLGGITLVGTPAGSATALEGESGATAKRKHAWTRVHVLWNEDRNKGLSDEGSGMFTRFYDPASKATSLAGKFVPSAAKTGKGVSEPLQMDWEGGPTDLEDQPAITGIGLHGSYVGLWFTARDHVWFQEYGVAKKGLGWDVHGGSGHPLQLDDEGGLSPRARSYFMPSGVAPGPQAKSIGPMKAYFPQPGTTNTLDHGLYFWIKDVNEDGLPLLFVRIRNDE